MVRLVFSGVVLSLLFLSGAGGPASGNGGPPPPDEHEQYLIELVNRARHDPALEASRLGVSASLNHDPLQALVPDFDVGGICRTYCRDVLDNFGSIPAGTHADSSGDTAFDRLVAVADYQAATENTLGVSGSEVKRATVDALYRASFAEAGDRGQMLNGLMRAVGVGLDQGSLGGKATVIMERYYWRLLFSPQYPDHVPHITGTVFYDWVDSDGFYTPWEGQGGVTVTATRSSPPAVIQGTTWASGGYDLTVSDGTWTLSASGGPLGATVYDYPEPVVVSLSENVWVSLTVVGRAPDVPTAFRVVSGGGKQAKTGGWTFAVKKGVFDSFAETLPDDFVDNLTVTVDGAAPILGPGNRLPPKVTRAAGGGIVKMVLSDAAKNKLTIDAVKKSFKLTAVAAAGIDPTDGTVTIAFRSPPIDADVTLAPVIAGTKYIVPTTPGTLVRH